jgi:hypothetical protein
MQPFLGASSRHPTGTMVIGAPARERSDRLRHVRDGTDAV